MSWLRLDDGYDENPKLMQLSEVQRWRWTRVLIYAAKHRTDGVILPTVLHERGLARITDKLLALGLLDAVLDGEETTFYVHDWADYNPKDVTAASRKQRQRERDRNRDLERDESVTDTNGKRDSRAGARARTRPVPSLGPYIPPAEGLLDTTIECNVCAALVPLGASCPDCGATPRAAGSNPRAVVKKRNREEQLEREQELRRRIPEIAWTGDSSEWADSLDQLERETGAKLPALEREQIIDALIANA